MRHVYDDDWNDLLADPPWDPSVERWDYEIDNSTDDETEAIGFVRGRLANG